MTTICGGWTGHHIRYSLGCCLSQWPLSPLADISGGHRKPKTFEWLLFRTAVVSSRCSERRLRAQRRSGRPKKLTISFLVSALFDAERLEQRQHLRIVLRHFDRRSPIIRDSMRVCARLNQDSGGLWSRVMKREMKRRSSVLVRSVYRYTRIDQCFQRFSSAGTCCPVKW